MNTTINNSTIKEHYIKIQELYANAVNILTAINQSFQTTSSEITVDVLDTDDVKQTIRIPSFLYLESKIEQIDNNINNLFKIPKSGEAWFSKSSDMYKLELVKSNNAPVSPKFSDTNLSAFTENTYIFKDLVNPKTFLKLSIDNLPDNISKILVKKFVFFSPSLYERIKNANINTYDGYKAILYNLHNGIDYEEYDSIIDLPIRKDEFVSEFKILDIPQEEVENPYIDSNTNNVIYKVILDTLIYRDEEDSSIEYTLQPNQYLCLDDEYVIYRVISTNSIIENDIKQHEVILEEISGHIGLQKYEENSGMVLKIYNKDYSKYHYVELPLEENPYVAFFISTIYNNTRSVYSNALLLNLNEIMMVNSDGTPMLINNKEISYIDYYNQFCINVGDMLLGISNTAFPQLSNYSNEQLNELENGDVIKAEVNVSLNDSVLDVQRINNHLIDDEYTTKIINLHSKRNELNSDIFALQSNIDAIYNQLVTTDFTSDNNVTQLSLKSQLDDLYQQKITLQREFISIIENINVLKTNVASGNDSKFRIRGVLNIGPLESYIKEYYPKCNVIRMEVQYKYKSTTLDTTTVQNIGNNIFTDWNELLTIERERKLVFDQTTNAYTISFEEYDNIDNIIKWNQIDIPIKQGEEVVLRVRFKYNIGQPFINLYSPWSDERIISFPTELLNSTEVDSILDINKEDTISAKFEKTLINDGYQEHISNKIIDNSQIYFHMPENIYSGFNTVENKFISLKDKLQSLTNDINQYKSMILSDIESQYSLYLVYDNKSIELFPSTDNEIVISDNISEVNNTYTTKHMNLVLKNIGSAPLKIYSIFPGNSDRYLIQFSDEEEKIYNSGNYDRVPILIEGDSPYGKTPEETISYQSCGQWIYFKQYSIYNTEGYYLSKLDTDVDGIKSVLFGENSNQKDDKTIKKIPIPYYLDEYIYSNKQPLLPYRLRNKHGISNILDYIEISSPSLKIKEGYENSYLGNISYLGDISNILDYIEISGLSLKIKEGYEKLSSENLNNIYSQIKDINKNYIYDFGFNDTNNTNGITNQFILRYEHIYGKNGDNLVQFNDKQPISSLIPSDNDINKIFKFTNSSDQLNDLAKEDLYGGFLIPTLNAKSQILCKENNNSYIIVNENDSITIPLTFQYFLSESNNKVEKYLSFDIKKSLLTDPNNYVLKIKAVYNSTENEDQLNITTSG